MMPYCKRVIRSNGCGCLVVIIIIMIMTIVSFLQKLFTKETTMPALSVYSRFEINGDYISIAGLWKDLNGYNLRIAADEISCIKDVCKSEQALITFALGANLLMPSGDTYKIIKRDENNILLKSDCDNFEGYINIDIKNKTAYKTKIYFYSSETDKYQLLTNQNEIDTEIASIIKSQKTKK